MSIGPAVGNIGWFAASLPELRRFKRDAKDLEAAQVARLRQYLSVNANTAFGRQHGFADIRDFSQYAQRVPPRNYEDLQPWIKRIAKGEGEVLSIDPVRLFEPTSGSSGAAKLIPFTKSLQREIRQAVAVWAAQNFIMQPNLFLGRAYWSLTPQMPPAQTDSVVPIGFDADSAYLGGVAQRLINLALVSDPTLRDERDMDRFWHSTLLMLLLCDDLRLVSVWHPSFLSLLVEKLRKHWPLLLRDLAGRAPVRAGFLQDCGCDDLRQIWPKLQLISCWADGHAKESIPGIETFFPGVAIQPKGLMATEGVITLPLANHRPLAIRSHVFEFLDENDNVFAPWQLQQGQEYSVLLTTGGGLYRYQLGDRVAVDGFYRQVPSLRFLGRDKQVSDYFGEKLNETFVARLLDELLSTYGLQPRFSMLALDDSRSPPAYVLFLETEAAIPDALAAQLEAKLSENPHYALCVRLGQLGEAQISRIRGNGFEIYSNRLARKGLRIGDIKPTPLSRYSGWSRFFDAGGKD